MNPSMIAIRINRQKPNPRRRLRGRAFLPGGIGAGPFLFAGECAVWLGAAGMMSTLPCCFCHTSTYTTENAVMLRLNIGFRQRFLLSDYISQEMRKNHPHQKAVGRRLSSRSVGRPPSNFGSSSANCYNGTYESIDQEVFL
jgi:hypothetical protein